MTEVCFGAGDCLGGNEDAVVWDCEEDDRGVGMDCFEEGVDAEDFLGAMVRGLDEAIRIENIQEREKHCWVSLLTCCTL